jgi:hypothetical protein
MRALLLGIISLFTLTATSQAIKVDSKDALEFTKGMIVNQYAQYGIPAPEDAQLTSQAQQALSDRNEANRIYDMLAEAKLTEFFKKTVKLNFLSQSMILRLRLLLRRNSCFS